ncbi:hypothetical protein FRX31_019056 [Thalictrum thalictroides]|uniref:Uncharacterized protein n=1 Tax=Thalictrum thalictroides TaxID=46969 RepID=A0A7J6W2D1_THATH|nr:hypothetical protein FRX31_019056 [Thalictrum thalictroides]
MQPFSTHTKFFSSLKQVEKRLKSEHSNQQSSSTPTTQGSSSSLSAPLYLYNTSYDHDNQAIINTQADLDSNPPPEFLSHHSTFDDIHTPLPSNVVDDGIGVDHGKNDIQEILQHLGLLGIEDKGMGKSEMKNLRSGDDGDGDGGGEGVGSFYSKIVGVKGPKNKKEMDRLDGWIKYFLSDNDVNDDDEGVKVKEPLRLIHLLIGKAIALANEGGGDSCGDSGFEDMDFPSTVEEFLEHDPPLT